MKTQLLTPEEMGRADRLTIEGRETGLAGVPGVVLMERAGRAVAERALELTRPGQQIVVLCGPGNNGGDGSVAARHLRSRGRNVEVFFLADPARLTGDAAWAYGELRGGARRLGEEDLVACLARTSLVIDALFGAGLDRPLTGLAAEAVVRVREAQVPVLSVDLPSGIDGRTGRVVTGEGAEGCAFQAVASVTFFRKKPGHLAYPGRGLSGEVEVVDIGIPDKVLDLIVPQNFENGPELFGPVLKRPHLEGHKYERGHALVFSGGATTSGAARLAATAALRIGAGLVTLASPPSAVLVNACHLTAVMLRSLGDGEALSELLKDRRFNALLIGPGFGIGAKLKETVSHLLGSGRDVVLDADALSVFEEAPATLFELIRMCDGEVLLTPHDGEFRRLFPDLVDLPKVDRARKAAECSGAVVVVKGADTMIAHPDGRLAINSNGTPWLATAGSGDVLGGFICGLLAQGLPAFEAAAAGVWLHGAAGRSLGAGLIAEDLPGAVAPVLAALLDNLP